MKYLYYGSSDIVQPSEAYYACLWVEYNQELFDRTKPGRWGKERSRGFWIPREDDWRVRQAVIRFRGLLSHVCRPYVFEPYTDLTLCKEIKDYSWKRLEENYACIPEEFRRLLDEKLNDAKIAAEAANRRRP